MKTVVGADAKKRPTRALIVCLILSGFALFLFVLGYFSISTPEHFAKAAYIEKVSGNIFWVEEWRKNRFYSLIGIGVSLVVFVGLYFQLWSVQRRNLELRSRSQDDAI